MLSGKIFLENVDTCPTNTKAVICPKMLKKTCGLQKLRAEMTNLYGPLHLHKAHSTIPSHRESIMVAESWNFYPSHCTGLHTDVDEIHVYTAANQNYNQNSQIILVTISPN